MQRKTDYDLIIAGGGVAGAALAQAMSRAGARVLVLERETEFRDRVRGEGMHPWGVLEAERLGVLERLLARCARPARRWITHLGGARIDERHLAETSRAGRPGLNAHHPELQEALLSAAADAGSDVRRGARVVTATPGVTVGVTVTSETGQTQHRARLLVVADGAQSPLRAALGFTRFETPSPMRVAGLLLQNVPDLGDTVQVFFPPSFGCIALLFPLPRGRARMYVASHRGLPSPIYSGPQQVAAFLARGVELGVPADVLREAVPAGPLASFDTHMTGAREPAGEGVVLIGDAAGNVDPAFGCGLSLALRDARVLRDALAAEPDWQAAARGYAAERAGYYAALLRLESWLHPILFGVGAEHDQLRAQAFARLTALGIDVVGTGPDSPHDEATRQALFAGTVAL